MASPAEQERHAEPQGIKEFARRAGVSGEKEKNMYAPCPKFLRKNVVCSASKKSVSSLEKYEDYNQSRRKDKSGEKKKNLPRLLERRQVKPERENGSREGGCSRGGSRGGAFGPGAS